MVCFFLSKYSAWSHHSYPPLKFKDYPLNITLKHFWGLRQSLLEERKNGVHGCESIRGKELDKNSQTPDMESGEAQGSPTLKYFKLSIVFLRDFYVVCVCVCLSVYLPVSVIFKEWSILPVALFLRTCKPWIFVFAPLINAVEARHGGLEFQHLPPDHKGLS